MSDQLVDIRTPLAVSRHARIEIGSDGVLHVLAGAVTLHLDRAMCEEPTTTLARAMLALARSQPIKLAWDRFGALTVELGGARLTTRVRSGKRRCESLAWRSSRSSAVLSFGVSSNDDRVIGRDSWCRRFAVAHLASYEIRGGLAPRGECMFSKALTNTAFLLMSLVLAAGCAAKRPLPQTPAAQDTPRQVGEADLARTLSAELAAHCPEASPSDVEARQRCADGLMHLHALRGHMQSSLLWGAQSAAGEYDLGNNQTTRFDPLVFRRMYLSTFMFSNQYRLEQRGERSILHVPVHFRYALDPGEYPYPFWHSEKKWRSYQQTKELLFFLEAGQVVAVLRGAELDPARTVTSHPCDGCLQWKGDGSGPSRVALYRFMFSRDNPYVAGVDDAFRAFEQAQRRVDCMSCHNPGNPSKMNPLELFSYPNQALGSRHAIVRALEHNHMPPAINDSPSGIADESYRHHLLELARRFAAAGDRALEFETRAISMRPE